MSDPSNCLTRPPKTDLLTGLVFTLFFLSGAFALVYEVAWVRAMTLHFGSTSLAVSTVLTVFMGGLALGAWIAGQRADRFAAPLTRYGVIEVCLALYAFLTPILFHWVLPGFEWFGAHLTGHFWLVSVVRFLVVAILLLPPTVLMGATLPILSRHYVLSKGDGGRGAGLLYGVNTMGAVLGTLAAGFLLLPELGLQKTILLAAAGNLALGAVAVCVGRLTERRRATPAHSSDPLSPDSEPSADRVSSVLVAVALSGFAALACEVAWSRLLALILGASVYAFTVMLSTFLAGLGLGAASVAIYLRIAPARARSTFYILALMAAVLLGVSTVTFQFLPGLFVRFYWLADLERNPERVLWVQFVMAAGVMMVPAFVMGGLFPAALRMTVRDPDQTSRRVGVLYAWNTVGTILGSFAAGFVLIPLLGIRGTLLVAVSSQCAAAISVVIPGKRKPHAVALTAVGVCVFLLVLWLTPAWDRQLMTSAMYKYASAYRDLEARGLKEKLIQKEELLYYRDGLTATVTVVRDLASYDEALFIATNGKADGSSHSDMPTQRLLAHVPMLCHHAPREVCVIGMGTGCTAGSVALHESVRRVTVVEIESAMIEGARFFREHNHGVHDNDKVSILVTDGRLFLRLNPEKFDVVISEPSNPWLSGCSDLFTSEFFRLGARALRPEGLFCQWVPFYSLSRENFKTIVRTFSEVFPHVYLISTILNSDVLLLGSRDPFAPDTERALSRLQRKEIRADLADPRVDIETIHDFWARFRMGPDEVRTFVGSGPLHTDDLPLIAYSAPKDLYRDTRWENRVLLARHARGIAPYLQGLPGSTDEKRDFLRRLAASYRAFLRGAFLRGAFVRGAFLHGGREALECERLAAQLGTSHGKG